MNKKLLMSIAALAVAAVAGYNVYQSRTNTMGLSDLALANVEALADNEGGYAEECKIFPIYSYVGTTYGIEEERYHKDAFTDVLVTYEAKYCQASGKGTLKGVNTLISRWIKDTKEVACNNQH